MNIKNFIKTASSDFQTFYYPTTTSKGIASDEIYLIDENTKERSLFCGSEYYSVLHFFGLYDASEQDTGKIMCEQLLDLLTNEQYDKTYILNHYLEICKEQPLLYIYLKGIHHFMNDRPDNVKEDISMVIASYDEMKQYLSEIFILPYQKIKTPVPSHLILINEQILKHKNSSSIFFQLHEKYQTFNMQEHLSSIDDYVTQKLAYRKLYNTDTTLSDDEVDKQVALAVNSIDNKFYVVFVEFVLHLLDNDSVIRICPNCNRAFVAKCTSRTTYCNRLFRDTKSICQEYASQIQYKQRKNENPVHKLYTKCYNKLYSRVRTGKLDIDSDLFQQLYGLRDEYLEKYAKNPNDELLQEFAQLLKNL